MCYAGFIVCLSVIRQAAVQDLSSCHLGLASGTAGGRLKKNGLFCINACDWALFTVNNSRHELFLLVEQ